MSEQDVIQRMVVQFCVLGYSPNKTYQSMKIADKKMFFIEVWYFDATNIFLSDTIDFTVTITQSSRPKRVSLQIVENRIKVMIKDHSSRQQQES